MIELRASNQSLGVTSNQFTKSYMNRHISLEIATTSEDKNFSRQSSPIGGRTVHTLPSIPELNIPSQKKKGRLIKGFVLHQDASNPLQFMSLTPTGGIVAVQQKRTKGSFPSKYETVIYKRNIQQAFGSSAERFDPNSSQGNLKGSIQPNEKEPIPGPGSYMNEASLNTFGKETESDSKKGYGNGFVSRSKRFNADQNSIEYIYAKLKASPGPGHYDINQHGHKRPYSAISTDISTSASKTFSNSQIAIASLKQKQSQSQDRFKSQSLDSEKNPGPGDYKIREPNNKYKGITIPKSIPVSSMVPLESQNNVLVAPGYYSINENSVKKYNYHTQIKPPKVPMSKLNKIKNVIQRIHAKPPIPNPVDHQKLFNTLNIKDFDVANSKDLVGPGYYGLNKVNSMQGIAEKKKMLEGESSAFMKPEHSSHYKENLIYQSMIPHYKELGMIPGPGAYKDMSLNIYNSKTDGLGSAPFKSDVIQTEVFIQILRSKEGPGPAYYDMSNSSPKKPNFNMNPERNFVI